MGKQSTEVSRSKRSHTAEGAAALRAVGHLDKDPAHHNPDGLAIRFLSPMMRLRVRFWPVRVLTMRAVERLLPGVYTFLIARTKHIDDVFLSEVHSGVNQVVILGAGADSRAYRFADVRPGVTVFELDHPLTSAWKQRQVYRLFGHLPAHVRYVTIDFDHESLDQALASVNLSQPVLFIWEGVTPYLSRRAIDSILATVALCGPGSSIVFDYVYPMAVDPGLRNSNVSKFQQYVRRHGEPVVSGLDPTTLGRDLAAHGLTLVSNLRPADLAELYVGGDTHITDSTAVAYARREA